MNGAHIFLVQQKIKDARFENVRVIPMDDDNVFLTIYGKDDIMTIITEVSEYFNLFFSGLCRWSKNDELKYERGERLRLYAIPLHAWNT